MSSQVYAVILAGGSGTRFWPASREGLPKQLLAIGPGSRDSLIRRTLHRIAPLCPPERVLVATGRALLEATQRALPELPLSGFLAEPTARNTAACIGWAVTKIARTDPSARVLVLPSDHHIEDEAQFLKVVRRALAVADTQRITTIGVRPTRAETGYGYIEAGEELEPGVQRVQRFVEKPSRLLAEQYLASGRYLWNSGMFFFSARAIQDAIATHMPELWRGLESIEKAAESGASAERAETERVFEALPSLSIDYGVMEKLDDLAVIPGEFGWNDLGSWQAVWELSAKDNAGNSAPASALLLEAKDNLVVDLRSTPNAKRVFALLGVSDLCVVDTDDALLVVPRERAQSVRDVVEALKRRGGPV